MSVRSRLAVAALLFLAAVLPALGANDPGHDSLYVLKIGDNVTGNINLTGNLTATLVQATGRFFGPNIDIRGDGSSSGAVNQIIGTASSLELSSSGDLILNKAVTGGTVHVGWAGTTTALNVSGAVYERGVRVCLSNGTNCISGNNTGNVSSVTAGSGLSSSGTPSDPVLDINTGTGLTVSGDTLQIDSTVCTTSNGLCSSTPGVTGSGSANGVAYFTNSTNLASGSNLTFNGTTLTVIGGTYGADIILGLTANTYKNRITVEQVGVYNRIKYVSPSKQAGSGWLSGHQFIVSEGSNAPFEGMRLDADVSGSSATLSVNGTVSASSLSVTNPPTFTAIRLTNETNAIRLGDSGRLKSLYSAHSPSYCAACDTLVLQSEAQNSAGWKGSLTVRLSHGENASNIFNALSIEAINSTYANLSVNGNTHINGTIFEGNARVCTTANGLCGSGGSAGGWANSSTLVWLTNNATNVSVGNTTGSVPVLFVDSTNGRVGVGTKTPAEEFEVAQNLLALRLRASGAGSSSLPAFSWSVDPNTGMYRPVADTLVFGTGGSERMRIDSSGNAGINTSSPTHTLTVQGDINATRNILYGGNLTGYGADLAEYVFGEGLKPGDVVIISPERDRHVVLSTAPYDTRVAGIISTAPSHVMSADEGNVPLALAGRVPVKVSGENGPIRRGDLLTTSSTPGHAMRCADRQQCSGAILGKAMEEFDGERGSVVALVVLG